MSTKMENLRRVVLSAAVVACGVTAAAPVRADVASDQPAAIVIYPKVVVDSSGILTGAKNTDTIVQLTNVSESVVGARCFLVNATWTCSNNPEQACTPETQESLCPAGTCLPPPVCDATDFELTLTKRQPVRWRISEGTVGRNSDGSEENDVLPGVAAISGAEADPFIGELKCVEVDPADFKPINQLPYQPKRNPTGDLIGTATIVSGSSKALDAREYNAIGFQPAGPNNRDDALVLGGDAKEYSGCPNVVIIDHLFDDAIVTTGSGSTATVRSDLTVVPCTQDMTLVSDPTSTVLQFLVFNEFEQRFSTSTRLGCFKETRLSNIDTRPSSDDDHASVFNVNVQGTLSGQSRLRAVSGTTSAKGVIALLEEFWQGDGTHSTAANTHFTGGRALSDTVTMHPLQ